MSITSIPPPAASVQAMEAPRVLAQMRMENDVLVTKLAQLSRATRGLAGDLAQARRDTRDKQRQLEALRIENARLRAYLGPRVTHIQGVANVG